MWNSHKDQYHGGVTHNGSHSYRHHYDEDDEYKFYHHQILGCGTCSASLSLFLSSLSPSSLPLFLSFFSMAVSAEDSAVHVGTRIPQSPPCQLLLQSCKTNIVSFYSCYWQFGLNEFTSCFVKAKRGGWLPSLPSLPWLNTHTLPAYIRLSWIKPSGLTQKGLYGHPDSLLEVCPIPTHSTPIS